MATLRACGPLLICMVVLLVSVQLTCGLADWVATMVAGGISAGASLMGTTVGALMDKSYNVAVAGSIENYSKWTMILDHCHAEDGYINKPFKNINQAKKEAFASHKTGHTAKGTFVYCLYKVNQNQKHVHIMYSAPYDFNLHSNCMGVAITDQYTKLDANKMYYNEYDYMDKKDAYHGVNPVKKCREGVCIKGEMGTPHHTEVNIEFYPETFENLAFPIRQAMTDKPNKEQEYTNFINSQFKSNKR